VVDDGPKTYIDGKWVPLTQWHVERLIKAGEESARLTPQAELNGQDRDLSDNERRSFSSHTREKSRLSGWIEEVVMFMAEIGTFFRPH
jgi:hypothetical protein